MTVVEGITVKD